MVWKGGDLREPLVWRQENPVFHSSCELELGIALQSLQGKIDLIYACVQDLVFHYWADRDPWRDLGGGGVPRGEAAICRALGKGHGDERLAPPAV